MAITVAIANRKGGVGKMATATNLASYLSDMGYKVLAMDFDPQASLTISFGLNILTIHKNLATFFNGDCRIEDTVINRYPNLDIVPTTSDLDDAIESGYVEKFPKSRRNHIVKHKFKEIQAEYDFVVIDTPTAKGLLTTNALEVTDQVVIPARLECFSSVGFGLMRKFILEITRPWRNPAIDILGILFTFYKKNTDTREHNEIIRKSFFKAFLFESRIRDNVAIPKSATKGIPLIYFDKRSHGHQDYDSF